MNTSKSFSPSPRLWFGLVLALVTFSAFTAVPAGAVNRALQTTLQDGTIVNFNVKPATSCDAIYITGGAQNLTSAGISPSGTYYFQVTDPSGNSILSTDVVTDRTLNVNSNGRITGSTGTHPNGAFNPANGETTVLLWPFLQTPNNGGVYKAWISTDPTFTNSTTKTDNFKCIQPGGPPPCDPNVDPTCQEPPPNVDILGTKFYDANANGVQDAGETGIDNWLISVAPNAQDGSGNDTISCTYTSGNPLGQYDFSVDLNTSFTITEADALTPTTWHHTTATSGQVNSGDGTVDPVQGPNFGNVCLGGNGGGLTLGFWSNNNGQAILKNSGYSSFNVLNGLNLVNATGTHVTFALSSTGYSAFRSWLLGANATNMAYMLSAQLAAMELNVFYNKVNGSANVFSGLPVPDCFSGAGEVAPTASGFIRLSDLMNDANLELSATGGNYTVASGTQRSCEDYKKTALDSANNNLNFPQPDQNKCPAFNFNTSSCTF
jgi:hypothetical protein